ncbi:conserved Plasmodium protein, unknown function [Plasmodium malariae]|uniref:J domain-containing protein n=1 Tax=Plasmodium malariae TaxID=5858 RepID=A0A1D3JKP1_PLAMA|nr:conserved Plasmodium protein, unknown function [Plasmodium malariae]SBT87108.1 conserved Plasmodium protein, unknown function [Plasmodium malariae]
MPLSYKHYCRYVSLCTRIKEADRIKNNFRIYSNNLHNATTNEKNANNYFDYNEDYKLLKRLQTNDLGGILDIKDEKSALKKYLKLLKLYHPDTYMKEKNEQRKKNKEEIFLQIYNKYKYFSKQYENLHKSEIFDEAFYENEEERSERLERYRRYTEGKRIDTDLKHIEVYILMSILLIFFAVFFICAYLPFNINCIRDEFYDTTEGGEHAQMVSCFYNPIMKRYEYLTGSFIPPKPEQLYYFYKNNFPNLFLDEDILKLKRFEIVKLPKNRAKKCRLVYDLKTNELIFLKKKKKE